VDYFEKSLVGIKSNHQIYLPHVIKLVGDSKLPRGIYSVKTSSSQQMIFSKFDGVWRGEILAFVEPERKYFTAKAIPTEDKPESPPVIPLKLLMQFEAEDRKHDKSSGLDRLAKPFTPKSPTFIPMIPLGNSKEPNNLVPAELSDTMLNLIPEISLSPSTLGENEIKQDWDTLDLSFEQRKIKNDISSATGGLICKNGCVMTRKIFYTGDWAICSSCAGQLKQDNNRARQLAANGSTKPAVKCSCWKKQALGSVCIKHKHKISIDCCQQPTII